jgi:uncharacterized protein with ParB-like and HNH nuclease domain
VTCLTLSCNFKEDMKEKKLTKLSSMLDSQFKILHLFGVNKAFQLLKSITKKSLYPMLLKCYHHLHLVIDCEIEFVN